MSWFVQDTGLLVLSPGKSQANWDELVTLLIMCHLQILSLSSTVTLAPTQYSLKHELGKQTYFSSTQSVNLGQVSKSEPPFCRL